MSFMIKWHRFPSTLARCNYLRKFSSHIYQKQPWFIVQNHCTMNHSQERLKTKCYIRTICFDQNLCKRDQSTEDRVNINKPDLELADMIESVAGDITDEACSRVGELGTMSKQQVVEIIKNLIMNGLPHKVLGDIAECPRVLHRPKQLQNLLQAFHDLGLTQNNLVTMIQNDPVVLSFDKEDLFGAFHELMALGFTSDIILEIIVKQPGILKADLSGVEKRIEDLKLLFNTKHTFKLVTNNPSLLFCDLDEIRSKFMYVYNQMGVTQPQMMHTQIFNYSLEHIHARHMFVVRAGFFRIVKEKDKFSNPTLDTIIDTSDAAFAKKFGNMTAQDYLCFKELLLKEELLTIISEGLKGKDYNYDVAGMLDEDDSLTDDE